jgi:hypothetical protein
VRFGRCGRPTKKVGREGRLSYGRWGRRLPQCYYKTGRDAFTSSGSSVRGPLSQAPFAVGFVVAVTVEQRQVGIPIVRPVAVSVMYFHDVLHYEAQPTERATVLLSLQ